MKLNFYSIKTKIVLLVLIVSILSISLSSVALFTYDKTEYKEKTLKDIDILAKTIGNNNAANLNFPFGGQAEAQRSLNTLIVDNQIVHAVIYNAKGEVFAEFIRDSTYLDKGKQLSMATDTFLLQPNSLQVTSSIMHNGKRDGIMYIHSDMSEFQKRVNHFGLTILFITLGAVLFVIILALFLQRFITAASIAPVPLEAIITTSSVAKRLNRCFLVFSKISSNSGVR